MRWNRPGCLVEEADGKYEVIVIRLSYFQHRDAGVADEPMPLSGSPRCGKCGVSDLVDYPELNSVVSLSK
jgi:hypothetical protein